MNASTAIRPFRSAAAAIGVDLGDRQGEWLLAEDVLAGVQGADRPLGVEAVRQRDVDDVDRRVGEERVEGRVGGRRAVPLGEAPGRAPGRGRRPPAGSPRGLSSRARTIRGAIRPGPRIPQRESVAARSCVVQQLLLVLVAAPCPA